MTDRIVLQHEDAESYRASKITIQYDGRTVDLDVNSDGSVYAGNRAEAEAVVESFDKFFRISDEDDSNGYVLEDLNVSEVEEYVADVDDVERLKELRELETGGRNRKTARQVIDNRISKVNYNNEETEAEGE